MRSTATIAITVACAGLWLGACVKSDDLTKFNHDAASTKDTGGQTDMPAGQDMSAMESSADMPPVGDGGGGDHAGTCDPITASGCDTAKEGCSVAPSMDGKSCAPGCRKLGTKAVGDSCKTSEDCVTGTSCAGSNTSMMHCWLNCDDSHECPMDMGYNCVPIVFALGDAGMIDCGVSVCSK
jgi:hypothetical protein